MSKGILIKLGGQCNWNCKHCHNKNVNYPYNAKIIDYIKMNGYKRVTFSGGEPLLYWNTIKKICRALGKDYQYKIVTNGSLLDVGMVSFIADYKIQLIYSFDGSDGNRTNDPPPNYRDLAALPHDQTCFSTVVYKQNMNLEKIQRELNEVCEQWGLRYKTSLQPEFIHQTDDTADDGTDIETAKEYCRQMARIIEPEIVRFVNAGAEERKQLRYEFMTLNRALKKWFFEKAPSKGCRCFHEQQQSISLDGRFLACPYSDAFTIGDIKSGIDWEALQKLIPEKCKKCSIYNICQCSCLANKTENECFIAKTMNRWLNKVVDKYNAHEALEAFKRE